MIPTASNQPVRASDGPVFLHLETEHVVGVLALRDPKRGEAAYAELLRRIGSGSTGPVMTLGPGHQLLPYPTRIAALRAACAARDQIQAQLRAFAVLASFRLSVSDVDDPIDLALREAVAAEPHEWQDAVATAQQEGWRHGPFTRQARVLFARLTTITPAEVVALDAAYALHEPAFLEAWDAVQGAATAEPWRGWLDAVIEDLWPRAAAAVTRAGIPLDATQSHMDWRTSPNVGVGMVRAACGRAAALAAAQEVSADALRDLCRPWGEVIS